MHAVPGTPPELLPQLLTRAVPFLSLARRPHDATFQIERICADHGDRRLVCTAIFGVVDRAAVPAIRRLVKPAEQRDTPQGAIAFGGVAIAGITHARGRADDV